MKLTIPFELKNNLRQPRIKPALRLGKNTSRICFNASCAEMMQLTKETKIMIGLDESDNSWYIYKEEKGIMIQNHNKGEGQQPQFVIVSSTLSKIIKKNFGVQDNNALLLFVDEPFKDSEATYYKLSTL